MKNEYLFISVYFLSVNFVTLFLYGFDKQAARKGKARIPEFTLHLLAFIGGSPFAFLAQRIFHHKTRKTAFQVLFWLIAGLQIIVIFLFWKLRN